jgi:hypothetical protein
VEKYNLVAVFPTVLEYTRGYDFGDFDQASLVSIAQLMAACASLLPSVIGSSIRVRLDSIEAANQLTIGFECVLQFAQGIFISRGRVRQSSGNVLMKDKVVLKPIEPPRLVRVKCRDSGFELVKSCPKFRPVGLIPLLLDLVVVKLGKFHNLIQNLAHTLVPHSFSEFHPW